MAKGKGNYKELNDEQFFKSEMAKMEVTTLTIYQSYCE